MDKETLSNYGWIVICVMVLAVMLAFASPFGNFVADAIKSTTQGLFDVNQGALDAAGIQIMEQEFEEMLNGTSQNDCPIKYGQFYTIEIQEGAYYKYKFYEDGSLDFAYYGGGQLLGSDTAPAGTVGYDGLNLTGVNSETGETEVVATITADGKQIDMGDGFVLCLEGESENEYVYYNNGYVYTLLQDGYSTVEEARERSILFFENQTGFSWAEYVANIPSGYEWQALGILCGGIDLTDDGFVANENPSMYWSVAVIDRTQSSYGEILNEISGYPVTSAFYAFLGCSNMTVSPVLPETITDLYCTYEDCSSLISMPNIPSGVTSLYSVFTACSKLETVVIPSNITAIGESIFADCIHLTSVTIPKECTLIDTGAFKTTTSLTTIHYLGTMSEWSNVKLGSEWNKNSAITYIVCSDGTVSLS